MPQLSDLRQEKDRVLLQNPAGFFAIVGTGHKEKNRFVLFRIHFIINKWCMTDRNLWKFLA
jgi:hypothetical protein